MQYIIFQTADRLNEAGKVALMIEECGGLDRLEALQAHNNKQIYEQALNLIENYFPIDQRMTSTVSNS